MKVLGRVLFILDRNIFIFPLDFCDCKMYYICEGKSEVKNMSPKMGRPPKQGETRNKSLNLRLTETELRKIEKCAQKLGKTRTDTIMYGVQLIEDEKK